MPQKKDITHRERRTIWSILTLGLVKPIYGFLALPSTIRLMINLTYRSDVKPFISNIAYL